MRHAKLRPGFYASTRIAGARPLQVRVPYMRGYGGGVRTVLGYGLPQLLHQPNIAVEYAELCGNLADMRVIAQHGVPINTGVGVPGSGILSYRSGWRRVVDLIGALPRLLRIVGRTRRWVRGSNVVYVHGYRDLLLLFAACRSIGTRRRPAIVWHCHGLGDEAPPFLLQFVADRVDRIVAVSHDVAVRLDQIGVRTEHVRVVHNAVAADEAVRHARRGPTTPLPATHACSVVLLPASSIRPGKGMHIAVDALRDLPHTTQLWITGNAADPAAARYMNELQTQIVRLGLYERVHFLGARDDISAVMAACDVVIVPSLVRESFGLVAAEAMALRKPVVVSNQGGLPEVVDTDGGLIFDPHAPGHLAQQIRRVLEDASLREHMARNGCERVVRVFSYERWQVDIARVLHEAAETRCGNGS